jgi:hypothetical protein
MQIDSYMSNHQASYTELLSATAIDDTFGLLNGIDINALISAMAANKLVDSIVIDDTANTCIQCGALMCRSANNMEHVCGECGLIVEGDTAKPDDDDAPRDSPNTAQLRIVGPNSSQLQPDLHRSSTTNNTIPQRRHLYEEFCAYRELFIESKGRALPLDACKLAADFYNEVQIAKLVKRSENKKEIMATCFYYACLKLGFSVSKTEISLFMQLPSKGIARGVNFVRSLVADGKMDVDPNIDPCYPEITTLFALLGYISVDYDGLRAAVFDIVQTAVTNNIGVSSIPRSKVTGATFIVLHRCKNRELVPKPMDLREFCQTYNCKKNTIERFTQQLNAYHSYFVKCYEKADLISTPA